MDFKELSYILAIAHYQNITRAAEAVYVSQPAMSKFLKSLEKELGLKLFRRLGHKYVLTYAGEQYVEKSKQILQLKNDLDREIDDIIKRDVGVLKIAFPTMRCTYMLPATLPDFRRLYPNVKVDIAEDSSDNLDQKILSGEVDVAFYTQPPKTLNPMLEYEILEREELLLCTSKAHPLAKFAKNVPECRYPQLDVSLLKDELVMLMRPGQRTRQIMDDFLHRQGVQLEKILYTSNLTSIMELTALGYGVSFVFEPHIRHWAGRKNIDYYSFGEPHTICNFVAASRKGSYLPSYAKAFIELVRCLCDE